MHYLSITSSRHTHTFSSTAVGHWRSASLQKHVGALLPWGQCHCVSSPLVFIPWRGHLQSVKLGWPFVWKPAAIGRHCQPSKPPGPCFWMIVKWASVQEILLVVLLCPVWPGAAWDSLMWSDLRGSSVRLRSTSNYCRALPSLSFSFVATWWMLPTRRRSKPPRMNSTTFWINHSCRESQ